MPFREVKANEEGLVGLGIDISERCNWNCPTCFAKRTLRDMRLETYQRIADEGADWDFPELYILGGEPGVRDDLMEILKYGAERFPFVFLVTNVSFLANEKICQEVASIGNVIIAGQRHTMDNSLASQQIELLLTGGNNLSDNHRGWENIEKYFPPERVCVQCCITKPVVESGEIFKVYRWARQEKGRETVMEFTKEGRRFRRGCDLDVLPSEMLKVFQRFQEIDEELGLFPAQLLSPQAYGKTCHMQENSIHFLVDGEAVPCVGFPNLSYGNITTSSLAEILTHPLRQHIKDPKSWIYGYCRDECPYFEDCTGGCRGSSYDITHCYRSSFWYCPQLPRERLDVDDIIPPDCKGCPLEGNKTCNPKRKLPSL